jgi:hypothetical protein
VAYDLTGGGSPAYNGSGKYGSSLNAGYGTVGIGVIPSATQFTFDIWVKTSTTTGTSVAAGASGTFWVGRYGDQYAFANYGSGGNEASLTTTVGIADNAWHHLRLTIDPSAGGKLYVDGVLAASNVKTPSAASVVLSSPLAIRDFGGIVNAGYTWSGEVDDAAVWSDAKTGDFTPALVSNTAENLRAVWHLDGDLLDSNAVAVGGIVDSAPSTRQLVQYSDTLSYSHTRGAAAGVLFVSISHTNPDKADPTSVTYGGNAMTKVSANSADFHLSVWKYEYAAGAGGAQTVAITLNASVGSGYILSTSMSFFGVGSLATPNFNNAGATGVTSLANTISVADGSYVYIGYSAANVNATPGTNVTSTTSANPSSGYYGPKSGAGNITLTVNASVSDAMRSIAVEVPVAAGGGGSATPISVLAPRQGVTFSSAAARSV